MWVHSRAKAARDAAARQARIEAGVSNILADKLSGPRCRTHSRVAAEQAATQALAEAGASSWVTYTITETVVKDYKQERRGRPGPNTRYREVTRTRYALTHDVDLAKIAYDAASDGCFPLHAARSVMPHPTRTPRWQGVPGTLSSA